MIHSLIPRTRTAVTVLIAGLVAVAAASAGDPVVAVFSKTSNGYTRPRLADNSLKPETYSFAPGGRLDGTMADKSIDELSFYQIAAVVAQSLKTQQYFPARDPNKADLLIFLSWGTTTGLDDMENQRAMATLSQNWTTAQNFVQVPGAGDSSGLNTNGLLKEAAQSALDSTFNQIAMANAGRDRNNYWNADVLGYTAALRDAEFLKPYVPGAHDIISDVEESRYFVVLKAYDFQRLWKKHEKVILWETRYSIRQSGNRFDRALPAMAQYASQYYGEDGRLVRRPIPIGRVHVGIPVVVEPSKEK